jgi:hypothetical protein
VTSFFRSSGRRYKNLALMVSLVSGVFVLYSSVQLQFFPRQTFFVESRNVECEYLKGKRPRQLRWLQDPPVTAPCFEPGHWQEMTALGYTDFHQVTVVSMRKISDKDAVPLRMTFTNAYLAPFAGFNVEMIAGDGHAGSWITETSLKNRIRDSVSYFKWSIICWMALSAIGWVTRKRNV